ncbi:hypothetical protein WJX74_009948 [Apatococcus lobatus]|uniref:Guanylate cyclase domain-containing protein n=1 Tax=Apatococcus lobatus TaxID=904363 RepID=A0AAW1RHN4_9CHLO
MLNQPGDELYRLQPDWLFPCGPIQPKGTRYPSASAQPAQGALAKSGQQAASAATGYSGHHCKNLGLIESTLANLLCYNIISNLPLLSSVGVPPSYFHYQGCKCSPGFTLHQNLVNNTVSCSPKEDIPASTIALASAVSGLVFLLLLLSYFFVTRTKWLGAAAAWKKRHTAPGKQVALVGTDIEGSTALYEWSQDIMQEAQDIHDSLLRAELSACFGYESATEGDSFQVAFHDVADAAQWALRVQQKLLVAPWNAALLQHPAACIRHMTIPGSQPGEQNKTQKQEVMLFRGLRVRMAIVYGKVDQIKVNKVSGRREYAGDLQNQLMGILNCGHGGQILMSSAAHEGISTMQAIIAQSIAAQPKADKLMSFSRGPSAEYPRHSGQSVTQLGWKSFNMLRRYVADDSISKPSTPDGTVASASPVNVLLESKADLSPLLRPQHSEPTLGRQHPKPSHTIVVIDMGLHELPDWEMPEQVLQLTVPGLVERAAILPNLQSCNHVGPGYECQSGNGDCMLAFEAPARAAIFCILLQEVLLDFPWDPHILKLQNCQPMTNAENQLLCAGPRISMGLYQGLPSRVEPHRTSGRADYFGPFVNRSKLNLGPSSEESECWGPASTQQQQHPAQTMPICFDACLDIATCYAAPVHPRATLGQLAELAYCRAPTYVQRQSRTSSIAPQLPGYVSARRKMSRMSVELNTGAPPQLLLRGPASRKLARMVSMPTLRHQEVPETGQASDRDHVALDLAATPHPSPPISQPGMLLEGPTLRHEASLGRLAEGPPPPFAPAVAAAMATSYFSELGLDDIPQLGLDDIPQARLAQLRHAAGHEHGELDHQKVDIHHLGRVQLKGLSSAMDVVHICSKRLSARTFSAHGFSSKASGQKQALLSKPLIGLSEGLAQLSWEARSSNLKARMPSASCISSVSNILLILVGNSEGYRRSKMLPGRHS